MGIGIWELLIIFAIVLVLFGTKRLRNIGGDLGGAIRSFRSAMSGTEAEDGDKPHRADAEAAASSPAARKASGSTSVIDIRA